MIQDSLGRMQEAKRSSLHPLEPKARGLPGGGRKEPAYNAQAAVDEKRKSVVAATVLNEETDQGPLIPLRQPALTS